VSHPVEWEGLGLVELETLCWGCNHVNKACALRQRCPLNARTNAKKRPWRAVEAAGDRLSDEAEELIQTTCARLRKKVAGLRSEEGNKDDLVNVALALNEAAIDAGVSECPICYDVARNERDGKPPITLPCGHVFHAKCIQKWTPTSNTCPMCRGDAGMVPSVSATSAHGLLRNAADVAEEAARAAADNDAGPPYSPGSQSHNPMAAPDTWQLGDESGSSPNDAIVVPE